MKELIRSEIKNSVTTFVGTERVCSTLCVFTSLRQLVFFSQEKVCMLDGLFFTDEITFHLSEYINSQKNRIMSAENPHALRKIPVHSSKIGAWCTVSRK